jgi:hypothetical protein
MSWPAAFTMSYTVRSHHVNARQRRVCGGRHVDVVQDDGVAQRYQIRRPLGPRGPGQFRSGENITLGVDVPGYRLERLGGHPNPAFGDSAPGGLGLGPHIDHLWAPRGINVGEFQRTSAIPLANTARAN